MKEYEEEAVKTIYEILTYGTNKILFFGNWAAKNLLMRIYDNKPSLQFAVHGGKFKGLVNVMYNEGADLFEYALIEKKQKRTPYLHYDFIEKKHVTGVFFDELVKRLDAEICDI